MKVLFSPIVDDKRINYLFETDKIIVTIGEITDTFDFSQFPNGVLKIYDEQGNPTIETILEYNPIISAKKDNDGLWVELLSLIGENATPDECFPEWINAKDYKAGESNG